MEAHEKSNEAGFWNNPEIVCYFSGKPPDPMVVERLSRIPIPHTKNLLDVGCGAGRNAIAAIALGFRVHMCDPNPAMIRVTASRLAPLIGRTTINRRLIYAIMTSLPYHDCMFDAIIACGVLHQASSLDEYRRAIRELSRVAHDGCVITLNVFTNKVMDPRFRKITGEPYSVITFEGLPMTLLSRDVLYMLMEEQGLKLEHEICEEVKMENTGLRSILRVNFIKEI